VKKKTQVQHPPAVNTDGILSWSNPVYFHHKKYGRMKGIFFADSLGFYRDEKTGLDYHCKNIFKWDFIKC
jgi:hypothetical protein